MGIPKLLTHLQPFAVPETLGCSSTDCPRHSNLKIATIDGPALAHHVFYKLLAAAPASTDDLGAIPSYKALGEAVVEYLRQLQDCHVHVCSIYFDGHLPFSKVTLREERCRRSLTDLCRFKSAHVTGFKTPTQDRKLPPNRSRKVLFSATSGLANARQKMIPPFLVPAVLEELSNSEFGHLAHIVPGEADHYCAKAAQANGALILTNDTDLLLFDAGPKYAVCFFRGVSMTFRSTTSGCTVMNAEVFRPHDIAKRLGLESLWHLGYQIDLDNTLSRNKAVQKAKESTGHDTSAQQRFLTQYNLIDSNSSELPLPESLQFRKPGQGLYPRVSELVTHIQLVENGDSVRMYLPVLLEDPSRSSAWACSTHIRALAYRCLEDSAPCINTLGKSSCPFVEYYRKGARFVQERAPLPGNLGSSQQELIRRLSQISKESLIQYAESQVSDALRWRIFALGEVCRWYIDEGKTPPTRTQVKQILLGGNGENRRSWDDIHLSAQVEGVLYSLSVLRQLLHWRQVKLEGELDAGWIELSRLLGDLPGLAVLMPSEIELQGDVKDKSSQNAWQFMRQMLHVLDM